MSVKNTATENVDGWGRSQHDIDGTSQDPEYVHKSDDELYLEETIEGISSATAEDLASTMGTDYTEEKVYELGESLLEKTDKISVSERDGENVYHLSWDDSFL